MKKQLVILGTRGIPAQHGGFETFAEYLSLYLVGKGWEVIVYCQEEDKGSIHETQWQGVRLIHIPINMGGAKGTVLFDLISIIHALRFRTLHLTLGYNTAIFNVLQRLFGIKNIINMDGIEWKRQKWGKLAKAWFWLNEKFGCWFGNHLIADHPEIKKHLARNVSEDKITMIPYGAEKIEAADVDVLGQYGLVEKQYSIVIARPEPENSILEIVKAFSAEKRNHKLVVLGKYDKSNKYQAEVLSVASDEVLFPGAIYDKEIVKSLRFFCKFYIHGHQVGGTNPSLVEALGANCKVIAHDNVYNRWVTDDNALYFSSFEGLMSKFNEIFSSSFDEEEHSYDQLSILFNQKFTWDIVLKEYLVMLEGPL